MENANQFASIVTLGSALDHSLPDQVGVSAESEKKMSRCRTGIPYVAVRGYPYGAGGCRTEIAYGAGRRRMEIAYGAVWRERMVPSDGVLGAEGSGTDLGYGATGNL
eukprot:324170-Rhodomonas_salina.1